MAKESEIITKKVKITNSKGLGYAQDGVYEVSAEEFERLVTKLHQAIPFTETKKEDTSMKNGGIEKR